ncbi:hypothetical protein GDO78_009759 [Eleutherodactylus coqui]|uniref:BED-type domain-containing protein n=1 Tax=Eleutherodactylus coqui TaxID=57060 RepID=A0A8J6FAZ4_ELECQ|nr:hypothetical protein GDO78_009759 [Eleutherodactylus coqui]
MTHSDEQKDSQELFSGPCLDWEKMVPLPPEEFVVTDAQPLESSRGPADEAGDFRQLSQELLVGEEVNDDDETQLSICEIVVRAVSLREERTEDSKEEPLDDEVTGPTWFAKPIEERSSEGEASAAAGQVGRESGVARGRGRARVKTPPTVSQSTPSRQATLQRPRSSKVWMFFSESADDRRTVVCNLCRAKISRGATSTSLTTPSMRRHMMAKHPTRWDEGRSPPPGRTTASFPGPQPATQIQPPSQDIGTSASRPAPTPSPLLSSAPSSNVSQCSIQLSLAQALEPGRAERRMENAEGMQSSMQIERVMAARTMDRPRGGQNSGRRHRSAEASARTLGAQGPVQDADQQPDSLSSSDAHQVIVSSTASLLAAQHNISCALDRLAELEAWREEAIGTRL